MNSSAPGRLQIVILAAGFSSRLGRCKTLARVHGVSLLRRTLIVAARLACRIVVVVPRNAAQYRREARGMRVHWAVNSERAKGLSTSLRRGIGAARYSGAILLMPADLAHLKSRDLERLARRWKAAPRRLVARRLGRSGATPVILPHWLYARALTVSGDVGLRDLIGRLPADRLALIDLPSAALDVDTPDDLNKARRRYGSPP